MAYSRDGTPSQCMLNCEVAAAGTFVENDEPGNSAHAMTMECDDLIV